MGAQGFLKGAALHRIELDVRVADLNYGNHLGNDSVLAYFHQGRVALLDGLGWSELDVGGAGLIMRACEVDYRAQALLFDKLQLDIGVAMSARARCRFEYRLARPRDRVLIATGITSMAFFDYGRQRVARPPAQFVNRIDQLNRV